MAIFKTIRLQALHLILRINLREIIFRNPHQLNTRVVRRRANRANNFVLLGVPACRCDIGTTPPPKADIAKVAHGGRNVTRRRDDKLMHQE